MGLFVVLQFRLLFSYNLSQPFILLKVLMNADFEFINLRVFKQFLQFGMILLKLLQLISVFVVNPLKLLDEHRLL